MRPREKNDMGRSLKRVPLDFSWPEGETWEGYINPHGELVMDCEVCEASGYAAEARLWSERWYGNEPFSPEMTGSTPFDPNDPRIQEINRAKINRSEEVETGSKAWWIGHLRAVDFDDAVYRESVRMCRMWNSQWGHHLNADDVQALFDAGRLPEFGDICPSADKVNWWSLSGLGHDAINQWKCVEARVERNGGVVTCPECQGEGHTWPSTEAEKLYDEWKPSDPPTGEGWQVWSTVSDSPWSPVFASADEVENWLIHEKGYSEGAAEEFIKVGHALSLVIMNGQVYRDIESLNAAATEE